ncbi:hypothetical protein BDR07DRAFT_743775 [Suillus spraguei]|nr:hypothetical protein BDR07DRAFT_743775 [Suillus spraguei]
MLVTSVYRFFQMLVTLVYRVLLLIGSCVQYGLPIDRLYRSRVMRRIRSKLADFVFAACSFRTALSSAVIRRLSVSSTLAALFDKGCRP